MACDCPYSPVAPSSPWNSDPDLPYSFLAPLCGKLMDILSEFLTQNCRRLQRFFPIAPHHPVTGKRASIFYPVVKPITSRSSLVSVNIPDILFIIKSCLHRLQTRSKVDLSTFISTFLSLLSSLLSSSSCLHCSKVDLRDVLSAPLLLLLPWPQLLHCSPRFL